MEAEAPAAAVVPERIKVGHEEQEEQEDVACCAICFEEKPFVPLPCACRSNYCASCWDRALATSVSVRGRATCPSCRVVFKVDFDPDSAGLVFAPDAEGTAQTDWHSLLYGKARPVQIHLLESYGLALTATAGGGGAPKVKGPAEGNGAGPGGDCPAAAKVAEEGSAGGCRGAPRTSEAAPQPLCVCGAHLERVTSRRRILRMLEDTDPAWRARLPNADEDEEAFVTRLTAGSLVTCDLCDDVATRSGSVWTCQNGPHTVLHPAAYDVCERCFQRYAGCPASALPPALASEGEDVTGQQQGAVGCCRTCTEVVQSMVFSHVPRRRSRVRPVASGGQAAPRSLFERARRMVPLALVS